MKYYDPQEEINNKKNNIDLSQFINYFDEDNEIYVELNNIPVQTIIIEKLDGTINTIMTEDPIINEDKYLSYLFQLCYALSYLQKKFNFFHNDMHTNNVMFKETDIEFIIYKIKSKYYKIKTYGKIIKIIDFGRAIFDFNNKQYFSDVFSYDGEAYGQYTYPIKDFSKKQVNPNPSFDLCYFAVTLFEDNPQLMENKGSKLYKLLNSWVIDKYGKDVRRYSDFELYKIITRRMESAIPGEQLDKEIFNRFIIKREIIPNNYKYLYNL